LRDGLLFQTEGTQERLRWDNPRFGEISGESWEIPIEELVMVGIISSHIEMAEVADLNFVRRIGAE